MNNAYFTRISESFCKKKLLLKKKMVLDNFVRQFLGHLKIKLHKYINSHYKTNTTGPLYFYHS